MHVNTPSFFWVTGVVAEGVVGNCVMCTPEHGDVAFDKLLSGIFIIDQSLEDRDWELVAVFDDPCKIIMFLQRQKILFK